MKKKIVIVMVGAMFVLASCGKSNTTTEIETEIETETLTEETEAITEIVTEIETEETEDTTEIEIVVSSGEWIDYENMCFKVNGNTYKLGETTLQDMIDDDVPFNEDDLANAGNNLDSNSQSQGFKIVLGDYYNAQVYVLNATDENQVTSECVISEIYLPVKTDTEQDILSFDFPIIMTEEDVIANAGEPTEIYNWVSDDSDTYINKYYYEQESTVYYSDWGYCFEFMDGEIQYITLNYLP